MRVVQLLREHAHTILRGYLAVQLSYICISIGYLNLGLSQYLPFGTLFVLVCSVYVYIPLAIVAMRYDRQAVASRTEWTPSRYYYLSFVPVLFNLVPLVQYLHRRRNYAREFQS